MNVRPIFAWYDLWVGVYIDRIGQRAFILPLPCMGVVVSWAKPLPKREPTMFDDPEFQKERDEAMKSVVARHAFREWAKQHGRPYVPATGSHP